MIMGIGTEDRVLGCILNKMQIVPQQFSSKPLYVRSVGRQLHNLAGISAHPQVDIPFRVGTAPGNAGACHIAR